jgi:hypothetical protein
VIEYNDLRKKLSDLQALARQNQKSPIKMSAAIGQQLINMKLHHYALNNYRCSEK